jgi:FkbH-like protein
MAHRRTDLPWLPSAPADFSAQCRALRGGQAAGADFQFLAGHRLTAVQAALFRRSFERCLASGADLAPLSKFKLAILSNATIDFIADEIPAAAARHGIAIQLILPDFDQIMQQALDPDSQTNAGRPDAVLLALDYRWFGLSNFAGAGAATQLAAAKERLFAAADALRKNSGATIIFALLAAPPQPIFGSFDLRVEGSLDATIASINSAIVDHCAETGACLLDVAGLARQIGTDQWFDPVQWAAFKLPFASECNAAFADLLGRLLGSIRGKARKCLVLDLDNTLWGGAIGDDGMEGIKLGPGSALGEAFLIMQQTAKSLRERGIILAVSSKNDDAVARAAFRDHREMVLREGDIAVFQANWTDKASNLEAIARMLDIGLDSLVMLDDNPAERAQLRAALPAVAVPELPDDPAWFSWYLLAAGYFEAVAFSKEDELRVASYAANAKRAEVQASARTLGDYLVSLETHLSVRRFDLHARARLAQLINKTNQFNLTTRRLTELQVREMEEDGQWIALQCRLTDRFGDMGTIGIMTARRSGDTMAVEDWVMSCRVLGRKVEEAMCAALVAEVRSYGISNMTARYVPTAKNGMVREHFDRLGFLLVREDADGTRHYCATIESLPAHDLPLTLDHQMAGVGEPNGSGALLMDRVQ